jgi:hypothetical protein
MHKLLYFHTVCHRRPAEWRFHEGYLSVQEFGTGEKL